ncbi:phage portal protein [Actinomadura sp. WMMB 499]|uniref:phage portal protein n=1 Tax=Actinomadura sp. WMMB 499 TaxID=1219491 RepID=UPI0012482B48|nr:phage portal protein [Actinomadura sp. WMMB 499]QFG25454.1 phage portal protein [Actinomadura sp. WMMB 499]
MSGRLHVQAAQGRKYVEYYDSENTVLSYAQQKFREIFGDMFRGYRDNFAPLIVDSISERLTVKGFRMGDEEEADKDALQIWQKNFLDADSNAAMIDAMVQGSAYLIVWGDDEDEPVITPESANEVVVQYAPGSRRLLEAGYREFQDDWGEIHSTLWLPDGVYTSVKGSNDWSEPESVRNPLGVVPIVPLLNRKRLKQKPFSELAAILPVQDAINKVSADAIVASEFAAFPQRIITGLEPFEDSDEERQAMLKAYVDRILTFDGENVGTDQFAAADLGNYVKLIDMLVQHMASQSRVPFHYFLLNGGQAPSGESITAAEAGLVAKARERMLHFGESWEQAMRLSFKVMDDPRAEAWDAEVIWADPEHRQKATLVDALGKEKELLEVPKRQLWEEAGYSPQQINRFAEMREDELKQEAEWREKYGPKEEDLGAEGNGAGAGKPAASATTQRQKEKASR